MDERELNRAKAEHLFTRVMLTNLMSKQCMRADDPVAEVASLSQAQLDAADTLLERHGADFIHFYLHELETFWEGVRADVEARVRER